MALFSPQELNALANLLQRAAQMMAPAEVLWAQEIHRRLVEFCTQERPIDAGSPAKKDTR